LPLDGKTHVVESDTSLAFINLDLFAYLILELVDIILKLFHCLIKVLAFLILLRKLYLNEGNLSSVDFSSVLN
jgi:hypothetical protein